MAPVEDLQSRDLAWISDFVMQQMVIMLRPMMDHLSETDAAIDYVQTMAQRLNIEMSEARRDIDRTSKYLAILRQGLGIQNEGKCLLQRSLEATARTVKRIDDQIDTVLGVMRGVEDSVAQHSSDLRDVGLKHDDLAKQVTEKCSAVEELQHRVDRIISDSHIIMSDLLDSDARVDGWHREFREHRRNQLNSLVPKYEDKTGRAPTSSQGCRSDAAESWTKKKIFASVEMTAGSAGTSAPGGFGDTNSSHSGSSHQSKRISRVGSGVPPAEHLEMSGLPRTSSCIAALATTDAAAVDGPRGSGGLGDDSAAAARLPILGGARQQSGMARPQEWTSADGPRLRFPATMGGPAPRGSPS